MFPIQTAPIILPTIIQTIIQQKLQLTTINSYKQNHNSIITIILHKMKPTNPNAHTYVNGTDVKTHGYAVTHNTFLQ